MVRAVAKLSPAQVRHASKPGHYGDGAGLWLLVGPGGGKSWIYRYMINGRARAMGLGPVHTIGLAEARERARAARRLCLDKIDPLEQRAAARAGKAAAGVTFAQAASATSRRTELAGGVPSMPDSGRPRWQHTCSRR